MLYYVAEEAYHHRVAHAVTAVSQANPPLNGEQAKQVLCQHLGNDFVGKVWEWSNHGYMNGYDLARLRGEFDASMARHWEQQRQRAEAERRRHAEQEQLFAAVGLGVGAGRKGGGGGGGGRGRILPPALVNGLRTAAAARASGEKGRERPPAASAAAAPDDDDGPLALPIDLPAEDEDGDFLGTLDCLSGRVD